MKKSIVKFCLIVGMVISTLCFATVNASAEITDSGTCGENVKWTLNNTGTLVISGTGTIDYTSNDSNYKNKIFSIIIEEGITSIGNSAFFGCTGLTSVTIPDSVTSIGSYAFSRCTGLTSVKIPDSVEYIEQYAFYECTSLTIINIPQSLTYIGDSAFSKCTNLNVIYWNAEAAYSYSDQGLFFNSGANSDNFSLIFGNNVKSIPQCAFFGCTGLTSVTIPDGVTSIGDDAFYRCTGLTSVTIGKGVKSIGYDAFDYCTNLKTVYWNAINVSSYPYYYYNNPFAKSGTNGGFAVVFGDGVKSIPSSAFEGCTGLTSVTISDSVTSIDKSAFEGCTGLTSVTIPASVTSIGSYAFEDCANLKTVYWNASIESCYHPFENVGTNGGFAVIFGDGVKSIPSSAFEGCTGLTSVTIPDSVTSIDNSAFYGCTGLTSVTIPASVTSIGSYAFEGCTGLTSVTIPDSVTSIGSYAFSGCTGLTSVIIPESVTSIGSYAFGGCTGLTSITIPNGVTSIGNSAFCRCTGLTSVTIPNSVTSIGSYAFEDCTNLAIVYWNATNVSSYSNTFKNAGTNGDGLMVIFGDDVESIPEYAFYNCTGLTNISVNGDNTAYSSLDGVLFNKDKTILVLYPIQKTDSNYLIPASVVTAGIFENSYLRTLYIPENLSSIEISAKCINLAEINVSDANNSYFSENGVLYSKDKTELIKYPAAKLDKSYTIPKSVTSINKAAFADCATLEFIDMPESLTTIGEEAFNRCTNLMNITIPENVISMGNAFQDCQSIERINYNAINIETVFYENYWYGEGWTTKYGQPFYNSGIEDLDVVFGEFVENIPAAIFYECTNIKSITLFNEIKTIGYAAFGGCSQLNDIYYLGSAEEWNNVDIRNNNTALTSGIVHFMEGATSYSVDGNEITNCVSDETVITIPEVLYGREINSIKLGAFSNCKNLETIILSNTLTNIDGSDFWGCLNLQEILVLDSNTKYSSVDGVLFNKDQSLLIAYPPAKQGEYIIPDTVIEIKSGAFSNASGLTSVTIGKNVIKINDGAFADCKNLKYIYWNAANVQDNHVNNPDYSPANIYIQNVGTMVGGCEIVFGDTVETIPEYTLYKCSGIKKVSISAGVNSIGYRSFQYCDDLEDITVSAGNTIYASHNGVLYNKDLTQLIQCPSGKTGDYVISDSTIIIKENAFAGCDELDSITIMPNIKIIARWAFYDCKDNLKINWNSKQPLADDTFHLENGYSKSHDWFNKSVEIIFGDSVENIADDLFGNCKNIVKVTFPANIKEIGSGAFGNDNQITDVYYKGTTNEWSDITIDEYNFSIIDATIHCLDGIYMYEYTAAEKFVFSEGVITRYLANDETVNIPDNIDGVPVTAIGERVFEDCIELKKVTIPDSVVSIGDYAFFGCSSLSSVQMDNSVTTIGERAFSACTSLSEIQLSKNVTNMGMGVFAGCNSLESISIPEGITSISHTAFYGCEKLTKVDIPDNVTAIYESAFRGCIGLTNITLPQKLRSIHYGSFADCSNLTNAIIPDSVTEIGTKSFYGCKKLKMIVIPENIFNIKSNAFGECTQLEDVYFKGSEQIWNLDVMDNIDEGNENLLNANIHYNSDGMVESFIYLSKTRVDVIGVNTSCRLGVASYNNNELIDVKFIEISSDTTQTIEEIGVDTTDATILKAFLWDGVWGIRPVCNSQTIIIK